jgi:3-deoxy-D-manno-octulosonic-acid transferase
MYFLYNVLVHLVEFVLKTIAIFNPKMKLFVDGRKNVFEQIKQKIASNDKRFGFMPLL